VRILRLTVLLTAILAGLPAQTDWPVYGHDSGGMRYSPLTQITPQNAANLRLAWKYDTSKDSPSTMPGTAARPGAAQDHGPSQVGLRRRRSSQVTPLVVGNVMYVTTAYDRAVALEPESGKEIWTYETAKHGTPAMRGLAYWPGDRRSPATIFFGTGQGFLIALNAKTGKPVPGFSDEGVLNLKAGIADRFPRAPYGLSSPPVIYKDLVITGSHVQEGPSLGPAGDVRAWDVHTGRLVWTFHTVPRPGEPGNETWDGESWKDRSGANVWGMMTVDAERGMVFLPIGCATADYYGGDRKGANLYGDTLVALEAATGKVKWHFQTTHHDVWDYDLEAAPALIDVNQNGQKIPAVAQMTKQGLLFLFDRLTGKPVYGVEERPTPQDGFMPGEAPWPTQPFPVKPPPLARNSFTTEEMASLTPEHRKYCTDLFQSEGGIQSGGPYIPHGRKPSVIFPGTLGGGNWHGTSFDPKLGYLFVNVQNVGEIYRLREGSSPPVFIRSKFWDPEKSWPCQQPPWGELIAVNVNTGEVGWRVPLGVFDELEAKGIRTGAPNIGGSIATAGGVVFVGGTIDDRFRAFDSRTGRELWVTNVGAAAHTVPITYQGREGKQYVAVMVSGGGFLDDHTTPGTLMVFALP
jgi:quinoprotein glucose dehydrogenase